MQHTLKTPDKYVTKNINQEFTSLYNPIHDKLWRFCRAISGNATDADDLLQDTVLNVMEGFERIKKHEQFLSFTFGVASNLHKMKMRRKKFKAEFSGHEVSQIIDLSQDQEYLADFKIVYDTIMNLPPKTAKTVMLHHISGLTVKEIQQIQGGSLSGVKERLRRGRNKVLHILNEPKHKKIAMMVFI